MKRKLKEKSRTDFLELGPFQQGPAGKPKSVQNDQKVRGEGKIFSLSKKRAKGFEDKVLSDVPFEPAARRRPPHAAARRVKTMP